MEADPYHSVYGTIASISVGHLSPDLVISLAVMVLLLIISGLVSGSEVAYFSLSPNDMGKLADSKSRFSHSVVRLLESPDRLLATILITNNFVNVGIVVISAYITNALFIFSGPAWMAFAIQVIGITALILFCSEIFPKIYANRFSIQFARITAPALGFFIRIFYPLSSFLIYSTSIVNRKLLKHSGYISIDDLSDALELTESDMPDEKDILKGIVKFGNIDVCEIMRPRIDVVAVEHNTKFKDLLQIINESGFSRIPVFEETFDQIKGILYIKDLLPYINKPTSFKWQSLIRNSYFVPESKKINDLLKEFQTNRIHMAIVIDEYGGTSGIVTMEDILEEIVGEITDESDDEKLPYERLDENNFLFEGKILLNDFHKVLELEDNFFNKIKGEADTLAGIILELRGEIPKMNDVLAYKKLMFTIVSVDQRRIKKIKVTIRHGVKRIS